MGGAGFLAFQTSAIDAALILLRVAHENRDAGDPKQLARDSYEKIMMQNG